MYTANVKKKFIKWSIVFLQWVCCCCCCFFFAFKWRSKKKLTGKKEYTRISSVWSSTSRSTHLMSLWFTHINTQPVFCALTLSIYDFLRIHYLVFIPFNVVTFYLAESQFLHTFCDLCVCAFVVWLHSHICYLNFRSDTTNKLNLIYEKTRKSKRIARLSTVQNRLFCRTFPVEMREKKWSVWQRRWRNVSALAE